VARHGTGVFEPPERRVARGGIDGRRPLDMPAFRDRSRAARQRPVGIVEAGHEPRERDDVEEVRTRLARPKRDPTPAETPARRGPFVAPPPDARRRAVLVLC